MMNITRLRKIIPSLLCGLMFSSSVFAVAIRIEGEVIETACLLAPGSESQLVTFKDRPAKDFNHEPGYGPKERFAIKFIECDNSAFNTLKLKFSGARETNMTGRADYFLKVRGGGNEGKLGVGLIDVDGTPLKLGESSTLGEAHNSGFGTIIGDKKAFSLDFSAYIQATPNAILDQSVRAGEYTSSVTFEIFYE